MLRCLRFAQLCPRILGIGLLGITLFLTGCEKPVPPTPIRPVRTIKVGDLHGLTSQTFPGRASAGEEVNLAFRVGGPLISFPMKVGQEVKQGEILAQIDPRDFEVSLQSAQGNLAQAEASLAAMKAGARPEEIVQLQASLDEATAVFERAKADFERAKQLVAKKVISQEEYDLRLQSVRGAEANLRRAQEELRIGRAGARAEDIQAKESEILSLKATVDAAQNQLDYATLRAPFAGTIAATYVENFQTVASKEPILRLLDTSRIELEVHIPEQLIILMPYIDKIYCRFPALGDREFEAKVSEIGHEASASTRTYPVTLVIDQPSTEKGVKILPGMAGIARGTAKKEALQKLKRLEIPETAVFSPEDGKSYVWIFDENTQTVHRREVEVGPATPLGIRIAGVEPGETIVTAGTHYLEEGQKVRLLPNASATKEQTNQNTSPMPQATDTQNAPNNDTQNTDPQGGQQP